MWETLERIGIVIMMVGFTSLGVLGWMDRSQSQELLRRLGVVEQRLDSVIRVSRSPEGSLQQGSDLRERSDPSPCDKDCVRTLVSEAIATMSALTGTTKQEVVERVVERVTTPVQTGTSGPKSYYVPLGAGETTSTSWADLPGAEITFNIADFGTVTQMYFEAQLQSAAGLVKARLRDKSAGVIGGSEISHVAGDAKLVSVPISVATGGRTIGVQLVSEVQQPVKLLSSRLRIDVR